MMAPDQLHIEHWGRSGPRVVMIHGGGQGSASAGSKNFEAQKPLASDGWQLVVPDRPGHGRSPSPGRPDDAEADGEWTATLLGTGAHLVGHSFGGLVALDVAARVPSAVRSVTLIEPALLKIAPHRPEVLHFLISLAATMILPFSHAEKARRAMRLIGIPSTFAPDEEQLGTLGKALGKLKLPSRATMRNQLRLLAEKDIPLLIISGSSSPAYIASGEVAAEIGGGQHLVTPSEHHFPQWAGASFNQILADFWTRAEQR